MPLQALINGLKKCSELTEREKQVLYYANQGLRNKEVANLLFISPGTVKKHLDNIFKKLQVSNKIEALNKIKAS